MNIAMLLFGVSSIVVLYFLDLNSGMIERFPFLLTMWLPLSGWSLAIIAALGVMISIYVGMTARAYQIAPPSFVAPFDYLYLVFAAVWSWVLFATPPDGPTIIGACLIATAGLLILARRRHA